MLKDVYLYTFFLFNEIICSIYHINGWPIRFISLEKSVEMARELIHCGNVEFDNVKQYVKGKSLSL